MDFEKKRKFESVYSDKVRAGRRRTYFFDVRKTKGSDYYLTITESKKKFNGDGYERHKIFLYKEDFNRFLEVLNKTVNHVKEDLLPDYDYDEFTRRHEEREVDYDDNQNKKPNNEVDETTTDDLNIDKKYDFDADIPDW